MFASEKGVHVTLVVHPRKEEDGKLLQVMTTPLPLSVRTPACMHFFTPRSQARAAMCRCTKTADNRTQISSIFGSAKATQESDNVVILQDNGVFRFLDVRKNRFDGTMGSVPFEFSKETMSYREMTPQEIVILRQKLMSQHQS